MNRIDYISKCNFLLNDNTKFTLLNKNPLQNSHNMFNPKLKHITKDFPNLLFDLKPRLPRLSQFYGIPKIHKQNNPLRPIISNTNSVAYKLSSWLSKQLKPLLGHISPSHLKNTEDFMQKTQHITAHTN